MKASWMSLAVVSLVSLATEEVVAQGKKPLKKCAADAVVAGTVCMDKYEASVWLVPDPFGANKSLVKKIQAGKVTDEATLTAAGATQLGVASDDYGLCLDAGQNCGDDIYAVSIPGVIPSAYLTWFQAVRACENSRKRLPSNAEWQAAVIGTPDPGPDNGTTNCNSAGLGPVPTGSRANCVSVRGAYDMVGNRGEWVADLVSTEGGSCFGSWDPSLSPTGDYFICDVDAALVRGGFWDSGSFAGPLSVVRRWVGNETAQLGFRCAR